MNFIAAGFRDGVDDRTQIASIIRRVCAAHHPEFLHPILRRAHSLHSGDAGGVVHAIEGEERTVRFAQTTETELQHRFREGRLRPDRGAASDIGRWCEQHKINEVATGDGQIGDLLRINHLARFGFRAIHTQYVFVDFHLLFDAFHAQNRDARSRLPNSDDERRLVRAKSGGVYR